MIVGYEEIGKAEAAAETQADFTPARISDCKGLWDELQRGLDTEPCSVCLKEMNNRDYREIR